MPKILLHQSLTPPLVLILSALYLFLLNLLATGQSALWVMAAWVVVMLPFMFLPMWLWRVWLSGQFIIAALAVFVKSRYHLPISEDILLSALMSEHDLTAEMLSLRGVVMVAISAGIPIVLLFKIKILKPTRATLCKQSALLLMACVALIATIFQTNGYQLRDKGHIRDSRLMEDVFLFSPVDAQLNLHRAYKNLRKIRKNYQNIENLLEKYDYQSDVEDLLLVFVIGESTRGDHFSLNGYPQNTNPQLAKIPELFSFNATSCDTLTINSVHCLASPMRFADKGRAVRQSSFGQILRHLGYRTQIFSLQTLGSFYAYLGYDELKSKYQITAQQQDGAKDSVLLPHVLNAIQQYRGGKALIIAHTLGSHQTYADRIFKTPFTPYCQNPDVAQCSAAELNHAYDNTVVGVDAFLADIIRALAPHKALLIYASDHGESLGEDGFYFHGMPIETAPKEQFSIPLVVWFSESYRHSETGKALWKNVKAHHAQKATLSHDYLFHSLLGCAGVHSTNGGIDNSLNFCATP